jgi:ATP-dependent helicase/nuclease subunit B
LSFRFILGRAGSGKTRYCLEAVAAELRRSPDGPPLILLIPEQATFQTDRALVCLPGVPGSIRAHVLSFNRLAWRVFAETGGAARRHIDELGKAMALRVLLGRRRQQLRVFSGLAGQAGFLSRLARTISELHAYGIGPEHLDAGYQSLAALGRADTALAGKLHDLAVITRDLQDYLAGRWVDPDDYLTLLAAKLRERPACVDGARVWVDGFAGFTPQELGVLTALLEVAAEVNLALCLDPDDLADPGDEPSTFRPTLKTYHFLADLVSTAGVKRAQPVRLTGSPRFNSTAALAHLEREYPRVRPRPFGAGVAPAGETRDFAITLVAAESKRAEVAAAGREMVRLAREKGYRWREMSVVVRYLDDYADLLQSTLADYGVPYFLDRRRPVAYHPLVEFVRSAVETALTGWAAEPVFRLLKTDLLSRSPDPNIPPLLRSDVDLLENYVLAHGIRGAAWTQESPWGWRRVFSLDRTAPPDPATDELLARVDGIRRRVAAVLGPFVDRVRGTRTDAHAGQPGTPEAVRPAEGRLTVREAAAALWELIERAGVPATMDEWRRECLATGRPGRAQEHERVFYDLTGLLDQLAENLGEHPAGLPELARILEAGLESLQLGLVPPSLDQVMVGSIERSRQPELKVCFVLGVNDGVFPAASPEDVVFDDRERSELAGCGMDLAPGGREKILNEDYLVYIALTRACERLWVSYARAGDDGRALAPSAVITRLMALYPGLEERAVTLAPGPAGVCCEAETLSELARLLASAARAGGLVRAGSLAHDAEDPTPWLEAYNWLVADPERRERARAALASIHYRNVATDLLADLAGSLYGRPTRVSISRLQAYAACPFSHFAGSGLRLEPRPRQQLKAPEIGNYYHAVLSVFTQDLLREGADLARLGPEDIARRLDQAVETVSPRLSSEVLMSTARNRYLAERLRSTVGRTLEVLQEHARRSSFRPVTPELRFSLDLLDCRLRGVFDRLEVAEAGARPYVRVIDFKSAGKRYDVRRTYHGLDIQLPAYLLAATGPDSRWDEPEEAGGPLPPAGALPAGAFFFPVADPMVVAKWPLDDEALQLERWKELRIRGVVLADPEVIRLMDRPTGQPGPPLLPTFLNKDGSPRKGGGALRPEEMRTLLDFTRLRLAELAGQMARGRIDIQPYRRGRSETACRYCDYRPVCRFDPGAGDAYRRLAWGKEDGFWALIDERVKRESAGAEPITSGSPAGSGRRGER